MAGDWSRRLEARKCRVLADVFLKGRKDEMGVEHAQTHGLLFAALAEALERIAVLEDAVSELRGGTLPSDDASRPVVDGRGNVVGHTRPWCPPVVCVGCRQSRPWAAMTPRGLCTECSAVWP